MRRVIGVTLLLVACIAVVAGLAVAIVLGPDSRAVSGPHRLGTPTKAVVTEPPVLAWTGATVSVVAEVPDERPVFVGVANTVDVRDYVGDVAHLEVTSYRVPWRVRTEKVAGAPNLPAAPTAVDWWLASRGGLGGAALRFELPDETVSLAVIALGDSDLEGLTVTVSYDVRGGFGLALGVAAIGAGVGLIGYLLLRNRPLVRGDPYLGEDEEGVDEEESWDDPAESDPADLDAGVGEAVETAGPSSRPNRWRWRR